MKKFVQHFITFRCLIATLILTTLLVAACVVPPELTPSDAADESEDVARADTAANQPILSLEGTSWQLDTRSSGSEVRSMTADQPLTAVFEDGEMSGFGGCNNFSGKYTLDGANLKIGPLLSTRKACIGNDIMQRETDYLIALESVTSFTVKDGVLSLVFSDGTLDFSVNES